MKKMIKLTVLLAGLLYMSTTALVGTVSAQRKPATKPVDKKTAAPQTKAVRSIEDTLVMVRRRGTLNVGVSTFIPWAMHNKDGELVGFEIEVAKKMADDLGVAIKFHPVGFSELIPDLVNNRYDIIISGIYPTPQRAVFVNFSDYYGESKIEFVASKVNMKGKDDKKDFDKPDVTIGVVDGTVYEQYATENFPNAKLQKFEQEEELYTAIVDGTIAGGIASTPGPEILAKTNKDKVYRPFDSLGKLGEAFAIRRGDTDLLNYVNTWIRFYQQNGWLKKERKRWFDSTDWMEQL